MIEPYYQDAWVTLYCGDMLELVSALGLRGDVVISDPPYGIGDEPITSRATHGRGRNGALDWYAPSDWDRAINPAWCMETCRLAPVVAWFGQWRKRELVAAAMAYPIRAEIVWAKNVHTKPPHPVAPRDERIWLFSDQAINGRHFETSVWDEPIPPQTLRKAHKNEKPLSLMRRLVRFLSDPGQTVIDPFAGSGSTLRAAKDLGRKAIGIELSEAHCEAAAKRLAQETLPLMVAT